MLKSIATVSLSGSLDEKLEAIARAGYAGVEIFENDLLGFDGTPADVGRLIRTLGLICTCYQPFRDFEGLPDELRERAFRRAEAKFDIMVALGADLLLVCSSVHPQASSNTDIIVEDFKELGTRAARRGLRIGYEALAWGRHVNDHRQAWDIVRRVDNAAVGLILDSFHTLARKIPMESFEQIPAEKIFLIQVADAPQMPMEYLYWSRHFRCMPSQGDLPVHAFVAAAVGQHYAGPLSLEIFNDRFREWSAIQVATDGIRSLAVLQDQVGVEPLPAKARILGIEFVEFAVDPSEAHALAAILRALGFSHIGEHRSKAVSLWRQGAIHLILNRDPGGWANAHWKLHGASVCAIALRVDDAQAALERATELNMETFVQRAAPGELSIPWIRGVGGSLTYFTEPDRGTGHWTHDFLPVEPHSETLDGSLGLRKFDHISQAMRVEEFLSWQLYYTSLFDVIKAPQVELSDTRGLVLSQAIESLDGQFRVTLNGSGADQTLSSRFVRGTLGAGVQHLALETSDIWASVRQANLNKLAVLPVPSNYYDDLQARLDLADAFVDELRSANIFYDKDDSGEYFQFYSRAFEKRFFFEIVERRGYKGYGAANSAVRLAAQARYKPILI
jgi:4-hydroxyphenylpyruvate dioxygenase